MMDTLPYFLLLFKQNALLCSILVNGSLAQLDLRQVEHYRHSDQAIDLLNFSLSEEQRFSSVRVMILDNATEFTFDTSSSDYFEHPERYFGVAGTASSARPYLLNGKEARTNKKYLGQFVVFPPPIPPASVYVRHSNIYGYVVAVKFYQHNLPGSSSE
jgi:hypothetical protein